MKRLALIGSWKRLGIQAGLLAGLGLAFVGSPEPPAEAQGGCPKEAECSFKKPNLMIIMDYSSSMNQMFDANLTRWEAAVDAVQAMVAYDNGFFHKNMHLGLMRFGHDPDPDNPNTPIPNDTSGIIDGQSLDVHWYDPNDVMAGYTECNGAAITDSLENTPDPLCQGNNCSGIGTWTKGALDLSRSVIMQTRADFPDDVIPMEERFYFNLLMTDGNWTDVQGFPELSPPSEDPEITAGLLCQMDNVDTYVVALGEAMGTQEADQIAAAGCTGSAIDAANPQDLVDAFVQVLQDIEAMVIIPQCTAGLPRIMIVLDASSSMLNVGGMNGMMGETGWDQAREALAGAMSIFDVEVNMINQPVEDLVHLGLLVFGHNNPPEENVLVNYGPCMKDNFAWALDPWTSCEMPGCDDPWGGPTIQWTFKDPMSMDYPGFDADTYSHMPQCGGAGPICSGSGTYIHRGLNLADGNAAAYKANPPMIYPIDANTQFANIIITDGAYTGYSNDNQVSAALIDMYQTDSITSYVIGFGDPMQLDQTQLDNMACWGSGGNGIPCNGGTIMAFDAQTQQDLEDALKTIIEDINFDACCAFNDCSFAPEPTTAEPDPVPPMETDTTGAVTGTSSTTDPSTTDVTTDVTTDATTDPTTTTTTDTTSGGETMTTSPTTTVGGTGTTGDDDSDTAGGGAGDDSGCGCSTDDTPRGLLGGLFGLGLLGFVRRRRR